MGKAMFRVGEETHKRAKAAAVLQGMTLEAFVTRAVEEAASKVFRVEADGSMKIEAPKFFPVSAIARRSPGSRTPRPLSRMAPG